VTPLAMANAYATFAAHGIYCKPVVILDIRDREGNRLPVPDGDCTRVVKRDVADTVTVMLNGVVNGTIPGRTGQDMALDERQVAGKTGTTNDSAAVWFAGYTPQLAAAVWVGDPRGGYAHPMKQVTIAGKYYDQVFGGTLPGPIWRDSMELALAGIEPEPFEIRNKYGLTTSDPYVYVPLPQPTPEATEDEPQTFDNTAPETPAEPPAEEPAPSP
jgi:membrane peptidoglycan carboxypeptidase